MVRPAPLRRSRSLAVFVAAFPIAALLSACATTAQEDLEGDWCDGVPILVVRNDTGGPVDIIESRLTTHTVITSVAPGQHEIPIRREAVYSYSARAPNGVILATLNRPRARDRTVVLERRCGTASPGATTGER